MSDENHVPDEQTVEHETSVRHADVWYMDGFEEAWFEATHDYLAEQGHRQGAFRSPLNVTVTIEVEEFDENRIRECDSAGGTVSSHRCEECDSCLLRKRTVEGDVRFYECPDPGCEWVTTEILR